MQNKNFLDTSPKEVIKQEYFSEYKEKIDIIYKKLMYLRMNLFVIEKLLNFPYKLLGHNELVFFRLMIYNFKRMIILDMWKIMEDTDPRSITLKKFKNRIKKAYIKPKYIEIFKRREKELKKIEKDIILKITKLRHEEIAHFNENYAISPEEDIITFEEVKKMWKFIKELFDMLCFGDRYGLILSEFRGKKTGVDEFLNFLATNSSNFNLPESNPKAWERFRSKLNEEDIKKINEYRVKSGKDPIK